MKNKIVRIVLLAVVLGGVLFVLSGCGNSSKNEEKEQNNVQNEQEIQNNNDNSNKETTSKELSEKEVYLEVLEGKRSYISEQNQETNINEYKKQFESREDLKIEYAILDLDNDNKDEMVILFECYDGFFLILNYDEDKNVYGFDEVYRGMINLKIDGTFSQSGGAFTGAIASIESFSKNTRKDKTIVEWDNSIYKIDGKNVSKEDAEAIITKQQNKTNVEFVEYRKQDTSTNSNTNNITNSNNVNSSNEEIIKELFLKKIDEEDKANSEKLIDYRVDRVNLVDEENKKSILEMDDGEYYTKDDILAYVIYSVKPQDINTTNWISGNGEVDGDWVVNKEVCVSVRNGEIVSMGTGW